MKTQILSVLTTLFFVSILSSCGYINRIESKARAINKYEIVSIKLAQENDLLKVENNELRFEIERLKSENSFMAMQLGRKPKNVSPERSVASVSPVVRKSVDKVKFSVYRWKPHELLNVGNSEFNLKNYEKAAQYFQTLITKYPGHKIIDDKVLYRASVAAYYSGQHYDWTISSAAKILEAYPKSDFYRGAKLWTALAHLKSGDSGQFYATVEEFRRKYRNTREWKILSSHYEQIMVKYGVER